MLTPELGSEMLPYLKDCFLFCCDTEKRSKNQEFRQVERYKFARWGINLPGLLKFLHTGANLVSRAINRKSLAQIQLLLRQNESGVRKWDFINGEKGYGTPVRQG